MTGRTKTAVKNKLKDLRGELDAGIQSSPTYTMALCVEDWLSQGLAGRSADTVANYRYAAEHAVAKLGAVKLRELTARHVQAALAELSGSLSTRSLRLVNQVIERAIRHAQAADLVGRNVASLVSAPEGRGGRPSRSLTLDQAGVLLDAAEGSALNAYVVLSLLAGLRTEELRSLLWTDVDLDAGTVAVYRSVRASGDTKTPRSRRGPPPPAHAAEAPPGHPRPPAAAPPQPPPTRRGHRLALPSRAGPRRRTTTPRPRPSIGPSACASAIIFSFASGCSCVASPKIALRKHRVTTNSISLNRVGFVRVIVFSVFSGVVNVRSASVYHRGPQIHKLAQPLF